MPCRKGEAVQQEAALPTRLTMNFTDACSAARDFQNFTGLQEDLGALLVLFCHSTHACSHVTDRGAYARCCYLAPITSA